MDVGSIVRFRDGLYGDEVENTYVVIEDNGDRVFIKAIMKDFSFPPVSIARTNELELLVAPDDSKENR